MNSNNPKGTQAQAFWQRMLERALADEAKMRQPRPQAPAGQGQSKSARNKRNRKARSVASGASTVKSGIESAAAPASVGVSVQSGSPIVSRTARSMRIAHRELVLASVAGSTGFTVQSLLRLNPGLAATFPWLAPQAQQWEQYSCRKLVAEWIPIAPTSTQGDVIISPNYDASDPQPTTEQQAANNQGAITAPAWTRNRVVLDPAAMMGVGPRRFVRAGNVAGDVKTFDVGTLAICSNNETGTSAIGKLYLEYDFEFFVPQNDPSAASSSQQTVCYSSQNQSFTNAVAADLSLATQTADPVSFGPPAAGVFTPAAGTYDIEVIVDCKDTSAEAMTSTLTLKKNGNTIGFQSFVNANLMVAGGFIQNVYRFVVSFNGTDTFEANLLLNGAAGTLTANAVLIARLA